MHVAGAARIGGVLEPPQGRPVIIEDDVFLGSQVSVMEGVIVRREAVLGSGVFLTGSTRIIDVSGPDPKILAVKIFKYSGGNQILNYRLGNGKPGKRTGHIQNPGNNPGSKLGIRFGGFQCSHHSKNLGNRHCDICGNGHRG